MKNDLLPLLLVVGVICSFAPAAAGGDYSEAVHGDLSGDRLNPTLFNINLRANLLSGQMTGGDLEYFRIEVPVNARLTRIDQVTYDGSNSRAFLGMQQGTTFTTTPDAGDPSVLAGYVHFGFDTLNANLLVPMSITTDAQGFTIPLPAGNYTFWAQQLEPAPTQYQLSFNVVTVPEPSTWTLAVIAILIAVDRRRRLSHCFVRCTG